MLICVVRGQNAFFETTKIRDGKGDELEENYCFESCLCGCMLNLWLENVERPLIGQLIGTGRLIIWLIIIAFCVDLAATFAFQLSNLNCASLTI